MTLVKKYKTLDKVEKKKFRKLVTMLSCPKNCKECNKGIEKCLIEIRTLIEFLMKRSVKSKKKSRGLDSYIS